MKKIALTLIFISFAATAGNAFAQTAKTKRTRKTTVAAKTAPAAVMNKSRKVQREKFDPKRDPAADLQTAVSRAQKENKRIILDVGGEWCIWCVKMDVYFLENKALAKFRDDNFIWIKVNFSPENFNREFLAKYPAAEGYPHLFVLETDGSLLHSQSTAELEEPDLTIVSGSEAKTSATKKASERNYDIVKFVEFLKRWSSQ
jgi:thiol:disulfide interchange protein